MNNTQTSGAQGGGSRLKAILGGNLLALTTAICWGFNEPANKILIPDWLPAPGVALSRLFGAAAIVWLISLFIKTEKIEKRDWKILWLSALMMLGFVYVFSLAFNTASPIDIAIILTFQPMLVVLIHAIFKHEKVARLEWVGMGVAFAGAILAILGGGKIESGRMIGNVFAMVAAVSYACYLVLIEGPSHRYGTVNLMRWIFLFSAILALPLIFTLPHRPALLEHPEWWPVGALLFIVLFPTVYCYIVTPVAIRLVGSEILSFYQYLVPVIAAVVSLLLKLDTFHWYQPVSFVIIVGGVVLANYAKVKHPGLMGQHPKTSESQSGTTSTTPSTSQQK
ncbi:MAG: DMT family transporter [Bacteroidales bacterium]|nr:DMT family transporter [Bacteroidales bacterium]